MWVLVDVTVRIQPYMICDDTQAAWVDWLRGCVSFPANLFTGYSPLPETIWVFAIGHNFMTFVGDHF